jgi:hypothetical protein
VRVLVCGSRHFNDLNKMVKVVWEMFDPDDTITLIHGDARGADRTSEVVFTSGYFKNMPEVLKFPANWNAHGKAAGYIRNKQMLDEGEPDLVMAFWDGVSPGTKNMVSQAEKAGVPVKVIHVTP